MKGNWTMPSMIPTLLFFLIPGTNAGFCQQRPGIRTSVIPPEGCYASDSLDTENLYDFIRAEIQSLAFGRDGENANHDLLASDEGPPIGKMAHLLAGLRQERIENTCAGFIIAPYAESRNEYIASVAKYLSHGYDELGKITDQMLQLVLMETMLQKGGGSTQNHLDQLKAKRQELLGYMTTALDVSLSLLWDARVDSNGKHNHMIITTAQQNELLRYLNSQFPAMKKNQIETGSGIFTGQAAHIRSFLSGKEKPSDQ